MTLNSYTNQSLLSQPTLPQNFVPKLSAKLAVAGTSAYVTFTPLTGTNRTTFKITNKGTSGAYIAWGASSQGTVTALASTTTPAANCDYVAAGAILVQDFQAANGIVDTIAAIQDTAATTLEISIGFGQ
jgi:hypothetical protein